MKRPWVIKAGGELLANESTRRKILSDLKKWRRSHPIVFVHGGGPQIEEALLKAKAPVKFVDGRRVTSDQAMIIVERVLSGHVNKSLIGHLEAIGVPSVGLSGRDGSLITGDIIPKLGRAAKPVKINPRLLLTLLQSGFLPVVSTVASDRKGQAVNINADDAASALAVALRAENLIFLTDTSGVLDREKNTMEKLTIEWVEYLIVKGVITGGMIPKTQSACAAIKKGVGQVTITNGFKGINLKFGTKIVP